MSTARGGEPAAEPGPFRLEGFLPYELSVTANRVSRAFARAYSARFGLSIPEWRVMAVLGSVGSLAAAAIVERTAMDKVKVSRAVAALEARRLVARRPSPRDRRSMLLALSEDGEELYASIVPLARALEAELTRVLGPEERARLAELLGRLRARAEALAPPGLGAGGPD